MEWYCDKCDDATIHELEYVKEVHLRPKTYLSAKLTCSVCHAVDWMPDDIFDAHACSGSGNWCYCNDTKHQHCSECDNICNIDPSYEP